jgi:hypothetical protein
MDMKATQLTYLRGLREAVLWKVEGVAERDLRMPMTPTGTNLLGLVKHLAAMEAAYFGECLGRPWPEPKPWMGADAPVNSDMFATAEESPEEIIGLYRRTCEWAEETYADLDLDSPARVSWWGEPETTLGRLLIHMNVETARHAGHLDIVRETVDGARGMRPDNSNLPDSDESWWQNYVAELRDIAERAR